MISIISWFVIDPQTKLEIMTSPPSLPNSLVRVHEPHDVIIEPDGTYAYVTILQGGRESHRSGSQNRCSDF